MLIPVSDPTNVTQNFPEQDVKRIQARIRGKLARNITFLPRQIMGCISDPAFYPYNRTKRLEIASDLCRFINPLVKDPVEKKKKCQYQYISAADTDFWIKIHENAVHFLSKNFEIDFGDYKTAYAAPAFSAKLRMEGKKRPTTTNDNVILEVDIKDDEKRKETITDIAARLPLLQELLSTAAGENLKFAECVEFLTYNPETLTLIMKQKWYHTDLKKANNEGSIPLKMEPDDMSLYTSRRPFCLKDKLQVFLDCACFLKFLHELGYLHRDVKPKNIFTNLSPEHKVEGLLGDFDFFAMIGDRSKFEDLHTKRWDWCANKMGIFTPFTDCYSFAIALATSFFPDYWDIFMEKKENKLMNQWEDYSSESILNTLMQKIIIDTVEPSILKLGVKTDLYCKSANFKDFMAGVGVWWNKMLTDPSAANQRTELLRVENEVNVHYRIFGIVDQIFQENIPFYEFVKRDKKFRDIMKNGTSKEKIEEAKDVDVFSMMKIKKHLEGLLAMLEITQ